MFDPIFTNTYATVDDSKEVRGGEKSQIAIQRWRIDSPVVEYAFKALQTRLFLSRKFVPVHQLIIKCLIMISLNFVGTIFLNVETPQLKW